MIYYSLDPIENVSVMLTTSIHYRGRFAPSPSGSLHFGSLVAALASYLDARAHQGEWLVRIEDLDSVREVPGAADQILRTLERFGFCWDGVVRYQSQCQALYQQQLAQLQHNHHVYPCGCSRQEIALKAQQGLEGPIYPGTCRQGLSSGKSSRSIRVRTQDQMICFYDRIQGKQCQSVAQQIGDFVVRRADGFFAYQLAVVLDDADQGMTHVVRGADLLSSTPRQIYLQQLLQLPTPSYAHFPVVLNHEGKKLSKSSGQTKALMGEPLQGLLAAYRFLGQEMPLDDLSDLPTFWDWAIAHWNLESISRQSMASPVCSGSEA